MAKGKKVTKTMLPFELADMHTRWQHVKRGVPIAALDKALNSTDAASLLGDLATVCARLPEDREHKVLRNLRGIFFALQVTVGTRGSVVLLVDQHRIDARMSAVTYKRGSVRREDAREVVEQVLDLMPNFAVVMA